MLKTSSLLIAVASLCNLASAQYPAITPAVSSDISETEATAIVEEFANFMNSLTSALESATDTAGAEAAAQTMQSLKLQAGDLQRKLNQISTAAPAIQQKLLPQVLGLVVEHGQRSADAIQRIQANNYYNCEALRECIAELQAK